MTSPQNPSFARRGDDPKMIGYWKVGRTIGKGSSGWSPRRLHRLLLTSPRPR